MQYVFLFSYYATSWALLEQKEREGDSEAVELLCRDVATLIRTENLQ